jgi:hypothetical protein
LQHGKPIEDIKLTYCSGVPGTKQNKSDIDHRKGDAYD